MDFFDAIILGIVEGITEFLPISSTGHLILANSVLGIPDASFVSSFEIAIQLGAVLAVIYLYWHSLLNVELLKKILTAFIPTAIIGLILYDFIKAHLLHNDLVVVSTLALGGIALIFFELLYKEGPDAVQSVERITYRQAAFIGLFQAIAIIPGVSRSAATIVGGLLTSGASRAVIVEFSFLLAVPTMAAATGLDLVKNASSFTNADILLLAVGFVTSFIVALFTIKWLLAYIRAHSFIPFGIYRIVIATLFFFFILH